MMMIQSVLRAVALTLEHAKAALTRASIWDWSTKR